MREWATPSVWARFILERPFMDVGSGGGFDCFIAEQVVGPTGQVIGVDMTEAMLEKSRATAREMRLY